LLLGGEVGGEERNPIAVAGTGGGAV
jgi:hypothetical protein